ERVKVLEDREGGGATRSRDDALIKGRSMDMDEGEASTERIIARELEEQQEREAKRMTKQIARDAEVAQIHAEEELQGMIDGLDRNNETIA
nr:hypothetical protein [Tanacetum cinerariifolium]